MSDPHLERDSFGVFINGRNRDMDPLGGKIVKFKKSRSDVLWFVWGGQKRSGYTLVTVNRPKTSYRHATSDELEYVREYDHNTDRSW